MLKSKSSLLKAGTRCVGITAAAVALADAGIPMRDLIVGVASGKIEDTVVLDLDKAEDNYGQADLPNKFYQQQEKLLSCKWMEIYLLKNTTLVLNTT